MGLVSFGFCLKGEVRERQSHTHTVAIDPGSLYS